MMVRLLILCALVCCVGSQLSAQDADARARRVVEQPEYRGYRIAPREGAEQLDGRTGSDSGEDGASGGARDYRRGSETAPPRRGSGADRPSGGGGGGGNAGSFPSWIGALFEIVAWGVLIAGIGIALFFIVKALLGINWKRKPKAKKSNVTKSESPDVEAVEPEDEPELDAQVFEDALEVARRDYDAALKSGDYAAATLLAYRIFWLRAGWHGCVEETDVRTWRDALRMVRNSDKRGSVGKALRLVERVRYADHVPTKTEFNDWSMKIEQVDPLGVLK